MIVVAFTSLTDQKDFDLNIPLKTLRGFSESSPDLLFFVFSSLPSLLPHLRRVGREVGGRERERDYSEWRRMKRGD